MNTDTRNRILTYIEQNQYVTAKDLLDTLHITPSALFRQLKRLILEGSLAKTGNSPRVTYYLPVDKSEKIIDNINAKFVVRIELSQFGENLTIRDHARQVFEKINEYLDSLNSSELIIEIDFEGTKILGVEWAGEFFSKLNNVYQSRVVLLPSGNSTVKYSLEFIKASSNII